MRARLSDSKDLWLRNGLRFPIKYAYHSGVEDALKKKSIEDMFERFLDQTCLTFQKVPTTTCDELQPDDDPMWLIQNDSSGGDIGPQWGMCANLPIGGAMLLNMQHVTLANLGVYVHLNNKDSVKYVFVNWENLNSSSYTLQRVEHLYDTTQGCVRYKSELKREHVIIPFDYMSMSSQSSISEAGDYIEARPVFVALDIRHQYLLDYHMLADEPPTFYEWLVLNTLYKCLEQWSFDCLNNGEGVPKCRNYGYVGKQCKCICAPGFTGNTCEERNGENFPLKKGVHEIKINASRQLDFATFPLKPQATTIYNYLFESSQFITVFVTPIEAHLPSIKLFLPFEVVENHVAERQDEIIESMDEIDCYRGIRVIWGASKTGRLAVECTSMFMANETEMDARWLRSRSSALGMFIYNGLGIVLGDVLLSVASSKFRMEATYHPEKMTNLLPFPDANDNKPVNLSSRAVAMTADGSRTTAFVGMISASLLLLLCLMCVMLSMKNNYKRAQQLKDETPPNEEQQERLFEHVSRNNSHPDAE